ncbi:biotin-dependent carboxyltransferase family protein [Roseospira marina]|uniref:Biotin-dependent carboxyltransferase family protein n=1 Tax=Roseospira marina TaxID=140057 RepID=A0A5M6IH68_9PROT|nr:biotin-dependent carboxyltransferase family protein [Roseospira marina]KAA5607574.1 biotin-dependent carboxyltransferase family protein [Roseospira marina]MBB4312234.1 allophanate hydrolase [Roseospira marina]MBB5085750.1 allophanate hydrolase [Roseospira marina]
MTPSLTVQRAGPLTTVQDRGRPGLLHAGVSASGPMDPARLAIANALVGNAPDAAALEFAGPGGRYTVSAPVRIAAVGDVAVTIGGRAVPAWQSHPVTPGQRLELGAPQDGVWGYLAIAGGLDTPPVLGARATHLRTGLGGLDGRVLRSGDTVPLGAATVEEGAPHLRLRRPWRPVESAIRVLAGPQADHFDEAAWDRLLSEPYRISPARDRMAQMLEGPVLTAHRGHDIVSDGTPMGSVQVPGSGQPMVLMAERQTTGGYPKMAVVASVDLPRLAQMPTGQVVRFTRVDRDTAEDLLIAERRALRALLDGLVPAEGWRPDTPLLLDVNLIDGVVGDLDGGSA